MGLKANPLNPLNAFNPLDPAPNLSHPGFD
jgi:hypothetical protein